MLSVLSPKSRIEWIDAMRGFSIFLVVLGHILDPMGIAGYNSFLGSIFLTFRMPLFFFVSGFFSYRAIEWWNKRKIVDILTRKTQAQIFSTIIFFSLFQYVNNGVAEITFSNGFDGYWFTIVLFQMYVLYLILSVISQKLNKDIAIPLLIVSSVVCIGILAFYKGNSWEWTFFCWENFTKYLQYFTLGIICSKYREKFFKLLSNNLAFTTAFVGWVVCMILWYNDTYQQNYSFAYSIVHNIVVRYCALFTVIALFFSKSNVLSSNSGWCRSLRFIGRRTLDIYMIHYFFIPNLGFLASFVQQDNMFALQLLIAVIASTLVVVLSLLVSMIIRQSRTLECWLFGVKKQKQSG